MAAFKVKRVDPATLAMVTYEDPAYAGRLQTNPAIITTDPNLGEPIVFLFDSPGKEGRITMKIAHTLLRDAILGFTPDSGSVAAPVRRRRSSNKAVGDEL